MQVIELFGQSLADRLKVFRLDHAPVRAMNIIQLDFPMNKWLPIVGIQTTVHQDSESLLHGTERH